MHAPGSRRLSRRETGQATADGGVEQRRLEATVARLRLELARLRGEVDDHDVPAGAAADGPAAAGSVQETDRGEALADAEARAARAEERVRLLAEELGAERRSLDELRSRLAALEQTERGREAELETALAEEREARLMLEALRDGLEKAMEEQRVRHEREVADVQQAAEDRRTQQTRGHLRELERGRGELETAQSECAALAARLEEEGQARSRAETRVRQLDREVDELRSWISVAESRRRGLFRRTSMPPPPGRIRPGP